METEREMTEERALCRLDQEKSDGYQEDPEQVLHFEGPFGLNEAGSSGLVCGLMARPPEAIGATSAQLLEKWARRAAPRELRRALCCGSAGSGV